MGWFVWQYFNNAWNCWDTSLLKLFNEITWWMNHCILHTAFTEHRENSRDRDFCLFSKSVAHYMKLLVYKNRWNVPGSLSPEWPVDLCLSDSLSSFLLSESTGVSCVFKFEPQDPFTVTVWSSASTFIFVWGQILFVYFDQNNKLQQIEHRDKYEVKISSIKLCPIFKIYRILKEIF